MADLMIDDEDFFHIDTRELANSLNQLSRFLQSHISKCYALNVEPESHLVRQEIDIRLLADRLTHTRLTTINIRK